MEEERLQILRMVEAGQIGVEQAAEMLAALEDRGKQPLPEHLAGAPAAPELPGTGWAGFWIYPLLAGGGVLILGALVMGLVYGLDAAAGWRICGWLPMIAGLLVVLLALWSRRARWLYLRLDEDDRRRISFGFPLPLTLAAWRVRLARPFVPRLKDTGVDDLILALRDGSTPREPLYLDVQDGEEGERIRLYIG